MKATKTVSGDKVLVYLGGYPYGSNEGKLQVPRSLGLAVGDWVQQGGKPRKVNFVGEITPAVVIKAIL